ncbi:MAG: winged helix-turn-helix transcriptional regulator [Candidatus Giovannonibacteria bacterium]|nr:MAG: winged helix-turn-helix transcriptional regulator [Candidatus Giovannonibacteria bacterium]
MNIKTWVKIFKALGNEGRIKILKFLFDGKERTVSEIKDEIGISLKATSKHLISLDNLGFLESSGKNGRVWYKIDLSSHPKVKEILRRIF